MDKWVWKSLCQNIKKESNCSTKIYKKNSKYKKGAKTEHLFKDMYANKAIDFWYMCM